MIDFRIERAWERDGYNIWVIERRQTASYIAKPIVFEFEKMEECQLLPSPSLKMDGILGREMVLAARKAFSGIHMISKEDLETHAKVEKAMQDHINSLKLVVDRTIK